jgi:hypothetical protein
MDDPEDRILVGDTIRIVCASQIGSHGTSKVVTGEVIDVLDDGVLVAEADEDEVVVPLSSIREWDLIGLNAHRLVPDKRLAAEARWVRPTKPNVEQPGDVSGLS